MNLKNIIFIFIVILAFILRFWQLGVVPPSPDWDEAALGYNAYSVLKTGKDEYGVFMPAVLRSFDDYKPPLYMYLTIPSVALFGLNVWSVRLPSAVFGMLTVVGTYFLVKELIYIIGSKNKIWHNLPLLSCGLIAISPWQVHFSRIAFEANVGVTLNIWMVIFFLYGLRQFKWLIGSAVLAALVLYAYHSERVFVPLLVLAMLVLFWKQLLGYRWKLIIPFVVGFIILIPLIGVFANPVTWTRLKGTSALSDQTRILDRSVKKLIDDQDRGDKFGAIFDNRRIVYVQKLAEGYLSHFSLRWLFLTGDNDRHHAPDMGLLYIIELPLLFLGLYTVARIGGIFAKLLFIWLIFAPIAAAPTTETPHAIRSMVVLPVLQIFIGAAIIKIIYYFRERKFIQKIFIFILIFGYIFNFAYYLHMYYSHMNREYSFNWQYGYKQAVEIAQKEYNHVDQIVVSTSLEQPHIFFLFYLKYPPDKYLAGGGTMSGGFAEYRNKFDKYIFRKINWDKEKLDGRTLYIGPPSEVSSGYFYTIYYLNGQPAINIAK